MRTLTATIALELVHVPDTITDDEARDTLDLIIEHSTAREAITEGMAGSMNLSRVELRGFTLERFEPRDRGTRGWGRP